MRAAGGVGPIVVACPPGYAHGLDGEGVAVADGGATRAASVSNALTAVETELVAIHDAARPLLTPELVEAVVASLLAEPEADGAIAAIGVADTIKRAATAPSPARGSLPTNAEIKEPREVEATLDRNRLWAAQTPQVFRVAALRRALAGDPERVAAATDESTLVEAAGGRVLIHPGPAENVKVTTRLDLRLAELLLAERAATSGA